MAEITELRGGTAWALAIEALVVAEKAAGRRVGVDGSGKLDVKLTVNGVEVDFKQVAEDLYARFEKDIKRQAAELVRDTVQLDGLEDLRQSVRNFDWQFRQKIKDIFGVELSEREY